MAAAAAGITRESCKYQSCYCEENVWWLVKSLLHGGACEQVWAVLVSNESQTVPLWAQRASAEEDGVVVWDYHVFAVAQSGDALWVYDLVRRHRCGRHALAAAT